MSIAALKPSFDLPPARGRIRENVALSGLTWFAVGGPAEWLFKPEDEADLARFLGALDPAVAVMPLGVGSNLLVRDGGIAGVTLRFGRGFTDIVAEGYRVRAGAGALCANVAQVAAEAGIAGLEFLSGIPGTVGGALAMNAGAYGGETADVVRTVRAVDREGKVHAVAPSQLQYAYRHCNVPEGWVFTGAMFEGAAGDPDAIRTYLATIMEKRAATQPIRARTGGSTFKNPEGAKAWELIDLAGCRGLSRGDAMVSELHCNFLINAGAATARDIEALGEEVRQRVERTSGVTLEWEIRRIGME